jgi:hypothetical protein
MREFEIELVFYKTAKELVSSFYKDKYPKLTNEQLLKQRVISPLILKTKKTKKVTIQKIILDIEKYGIWGYCEYIRKKYKLIHCYTNSLCTKEKALIFLGHELGHVIGYKKESIAYEFGMISAFVIKLYDNEFKRKLKNG